MNHILPLLRHLDEVYHMGDLQAYELEWQEATRKIECLYSGVILAYAEIHTAGAEWKRHVASLHVLLPKAAFS